MVRCNSPWIISVDIKIYDGSFHKIFDLALKIKKSCFNDMKQDDILDLISLIYTSIVTGFSI